VLENTFVHVPGVGHQTEARLWSEGILDWNSLLERWRELTFGQADRTSVVRHIEKSRKALADGEHQFFARGLKQNDAWRAFHEFRDRCAYLDIETDGRDVTMIGLWDGLSFTALVRGENLGNFPDLISNYSMIVTFAGGMFDLPQLQRHFKGLRFDQIHIDLCKALHRAGIKGGLKKIEKEFKIQRAEEIDGLTGLDAIRLWRQYQLGKSESALEKLIAYNRADVVNLEPLAEEAYRILRRQVFEGVPVAQG
jgi:uncharacterized protein